MGANAVLHLALFRQRALLIAAAAVVIVFILWNVPAFDFLLYPLRLFVTFVHEAGHGIAAILTGGQFDRFVVYPNGAGVATTSGGLRAIVLPAGYLGAALFGAALLYLVNSVPFPKTLALILALLLAGITLLFTELLTTAFLVGAGFAVVLALLWRFADRGLTMLILNVLALVTGLNAVLDIFSLVSSPGVTLGVVSNDAAAFSREIAPLIPPVVWALLWCGIAVALLLAAIYFGILRRFTR
jgi:hypothetical protein